MSKQDTHANDKSDGSRQQSGIGLPLAALGIDIVPILLGFLASLEMSAPWIFFLGITLFPAAGLIIAILALCREKKRTGVLQ